MKILSLDPRVDRLGLQEEQQAVVLEQMDNWHTYEVFHQKKKGDQHSHVGIVHAPNVEMAMVFAKEQFARRGHTVNLWVVKSADVIATSYDDEDIFATTPEKLHREPQLYKVREKIADFRKSQEKNNE